ncbi:MAG: hypothetical protein A2785_02390 [Candidatus Chisholmbacteria bacterium RIFCSPHIGHO2_01_FULL_49_18]|uniref:NAD-dependent epimerase/dehydratase domain-containing protein n=2 Tax=Candidatus Chisholmiibacteriota TaxID=1817900 RepID=A0A1G1VNI9_9BACT|nr:MAG: hypothetical protein A2785_02390 [Candidatus Chisholmbacteria bacterium RIFCSPHIGHO2_01_FULL_49_18]OGY21565.1 MAG: hypothetical protein A3A65_05605 [Candidatus Chisholmbacteria bacterium RIFCSPLOWO2_01_FULL_49_14]
MTITITGALGHIGSALIRNLDPKVTRVHLVDNLFTQRYASLFNLPAHPKFIFHETDILSAEMEGIIKNSDAIVHLAAITDAQNSVRNRTLVNRVNKQGVRKLALLAARYRVPLLFPSTTSVYGVQSGLVDENCPQNDLKPQSPYAESKLYGERLLDRLGKSKGLAFVTFRIGTIFGYSIGMRFHTAVNKFIWQVCLGQELTVWKTALHQKRPYCALTDAIAAINHVLGNNLFDREIYNIVTVNSTVSEIIDTIRLYKSNVRIRLTQSPIMNQLSYDVSREKSEKKGFTYTGNLKRGIRETIRKFSGLRNTQMS